MFGKKKNLSEKDLEKAQRTAENLKKFLEIEAIHLRETNYDTNLNAIDKIRISNRIRQDDKQKIKNGIKRDFLDEVKDTSQIAHDYKYQKHLNRKRNEYTSDENNIPSNDLYKNSYGAQLIQEARRNLEKDVKITDKIIIKNKKGEKSENWVIALFIVAMLILVILSFLK